MSWEAQNRLYRRTWKLRNRGLMVPKIVVAVARELSGFIWAVARESLEPGSVEIRSPRIDKSPKESAWQIEYTLRKTEKKGEQ